MKAKRKSVKTQPSLRYPEVTERKRTEENIAYLAAIIESLDEAIIGKTSDGVISSWNRGAEKMYGYSADEVIGKPISILLPPNHSDDTATILETIKRGEEVHHYETQRMRKNGTVMEVSLAVSPIRDSTGEILGASTITRDITERKRLEREVKSMAHFPVENPNPVLRISKDGIILHANQASEPLLQSWGCRVGVAAPRHWRDLVAEVLANQATKDAETVLGEKTLVFTIAPIKDANYANFYGRDITDRKKAEHELKEYSLHLEELVNERTRDLRESEERYRELFEASPVSLWEEDFSSVKGYLNELRGRGISDFREHFINHPEDVTKCASLVRVLSVNEATLKMYGAKNAEEITVVDGLSERARDRFREEIVALAEGKKFFAEEIENKSLSGETKHVSVICTVVPGHEETLSKVLVCIVDLTARRKLENDLRLAKERLEHVVKYNPAAIFIGKARPDFSDFDPVYVSENVFSLLGFEASSLLGSEGYTRLWNGRIHPEDHLRYLSEMPLLWKNGHNTFRYRFLHKDGAYRWIREEVKVLRDASGSPVEVIGCWTDSTERMRLEEENKKLTAQAMLQLLTITDQVNSLSKLRDKLKTVPDVSSGLNTILEAALWDFGMDFGAVLILDRQSNRLKVWTSKEREKAVKLEGSYPLNTFGDLKGLESNGVRRVVGEGNRSIFNAEIEFIVPILSGNAFEEVFGVMIFGKAGERGREDETNMRVLKMYADLIYSFVIERSVAVTPALEKVRTITRDRKLDSGVIYIVHNDPPKAFEVFADLVFSGCEGLCITRTHPPKIRDQYKLEKTPIVWLTSEAAGDERSVRSGQDISIMIGDFLEKANKPVVLFDGFEYLILNDGFKYFMKLLQIIKDRVQHKNGILIAPFSDQTLDLRELATLKVETTVFTEKTNGAK